MRHNILIASVVGTCCLAIVGFAALTQSQVEEKFESTAQPRQYADENSDGVNDNFVDADGKGVNDNRPAWGRGQNGQGNGRGQGRGMGNGRGMSHGPGPR